MNTLESFYPSNDRFILGQKDSLGVVVSLVRIIPIESFYSRTE